MAYVNVNKTNFENEVLRSPFPVLVDFWTELCGPCKRLAQVLDSLHSEYKESLRFAKINTAEHPELAQRFDVMSLPCLIFFYNGKELRRSVGYKSKEAIKQLIGIKR